MMQLLQVRLRDSATHAGNHALHTSLTDHALLHAIVVCAYVVLVPVTGQQRLDGARGVVQVV
jgi:hypothetical protein